MKPTRTLTCVDVAYLRKSVQKGVKLADVPAQRAHLSRWAAREGVEIARWYVDAGRSGSRIAEGFRDDYTAMLAAIDAGRDFAGDRR